jgi:hypothetical protein
MIETPTNHSLSWQDIVFQCVENYVGIVLFALNLEKGLSLHLVP